MKNYERLYFKLVGKIENVIEEINKFERQKEKKSMEETMQKIEDIKKMMIKEIGECEEIYVALKEN